MCASELLVPQTSPLEIQTPIEKQKSYESPVTDRIPAEMIQGRGNTLLSEIHNLSNSI
jgi:hypothetical protein